MGIGDWTQSPIPMEEKGRIFYIIIFNNFKKIINLDLKWKKKI